MAERAPGAGLVSVIIIYNNMIMMMPVFILFCVVVLLVVAQRMNRMPLLSKSPSLKVKQNPLPPFQHRGSVPFVMCHVHVYLVRSVPFAVRMDCGCISRRRNTLWTERSQNTTCEHRDVIIASLVGPGLVFRICTDSVQSFVSYVY